MAMRSHERAQEGSRWPQKGARRLQDDAKMVQYRSEQRNLKQEGATPKTFKRQLNPYAFDRVRASGGPNEAKTVPRWVPLGRDGLTSVKAVVKPRWTR